MLLQLETIIFMLRSVLSINNAPIQSFPLKPIFEDLLVYVITYQVWMQTKRMVYFY